MTLSLTSRAADAIAARMREAGVEGWLLRVAVVGGGCNGLSYDLYFVEKANASDAVSESHGLKVVVDEASAPLLDGTLIDLPAGAAGFKFDNPRARKSCACGASFEL